MAVWCGTGSDPGCDPAAEYHPFHGAVQRRCGDRPAWNTGYEASDPVCTVSIRSGRYLAGERLDFWSLGQITFEKPDMETFVGLPLAFAAAKAGGSMPTVFNAANERAVSKFLNRKIGFLDIYEIIRTCMDAHKVIANSNDRNRSCSVSRKLMK